jgi:hypothetical protein
VVEPRNTGLASDRYPSGTFTSECINRVFQLFAMPELYGHRAALQINP